MANYEAIREKVKTLLSSKDITPEQAELIGKISGEIDNVEAEDKKFLEKHEELRTKYIDLVKTASFPETPKEKEKEETESHDLAYFLDEEVKKKSNNK